MRKGPSEVRTPERKNSLGRGGGVGIHVAHCVVENDPSSLGREGGCRGAPFACVVRREMRASAAYKAHPQLRDLFEDGTVRAVVPKLEAGVHKPKEILLVGTAHLAQRSVQDVQRVIRTVKPQCVVVELCRSRSGALYASQEPRGEAQTRFGLGGARFRDAVTRSVSLGGTPALVLRYLLSRIYARMSLLAQAQVGGEFEAARVAAEEVGAQIVLGDRPIEITLKRAWDGLGWRSKAQLLWLMGSSLKQVDQMDLTQEKIEKLMQEDLWSVAAEEVGGVLPQLMPAIVHERDIYIAWSLKRSKAVREVDTVVGVIGKGHMEGVLTALEESQGRLRFKDLVGTSEERKPNVAAIARRIGLDTAVLLALGWIWNQVPH